VVSLLVAVGVAFSLDWRLALIVIIGAPIIAFVYRRMSDGAMRYSMAMQQQQGSLMSVTAENFQAQQVVKAFSLAAREVLRFRKASDDLFKAEMKMTMFVGWFMLSVQMIITILRIAVMAFGAWLILHGKLTIGAYVAFLGVMGQVLEPVTGLTSLGQELQQSMGALARVQEVMNEVPEVRDGANPQPVGTLRTGLRVEGIAFGYTPERRVLDGIDVVIPAGRRTAIVGPSGSGKSSLLQLLTRSYDPDEGRVTWDGVDLTEARLDDLRNQIGIVFQDNFAFDDSIRENIRLGRLDATDLDIEQAARQAELHDFILSLPNGYDSVIGERGSMLSGGQRQRLAIARALLRNPSLLVLDEATSALDARTERLIAATLDRVSEGRTTVAVTHRLGTVIGYDQIIVVVDGHVVETGTHPELVARHGIYAELWAEQGGGAEATEPVQVTPTAGKRLTRMTGVLKPLPMPTGPMVASNLDTPARATGTFGPIR
jgi:ATP-binding cassette subfamily B protein